MSFTQQGTGRDIAFAPRRVLVVGYTGRDQAAVRAHIEELAAHGIPAPESVPVLFRTTLDRLTTAPEVEVVGGDSAGEAEAVLLMDQGEIWIAVGSDITDRELEKLSIPASKQACPKPVSREVWRYADVKDRWDDLILRSWVGENGRDELYQEGRMASLLTPEDLLVILQDRVGDQVNGAAIFTGTTPLLGGKFVCKSYFEAELYDEKTGRSLRCIYRMRRADV